MLQWFQQLWRNWSALPSPLTAEQKTWLEQRFDWLHAEFGVTHLMRPPVLPTNEYFPERYTGSREDAARILEQICVVLGVDRRRITLSYYEAEQADVVAEAFRQSFHRGYAVGLFEQEAGQITIWLETTQFRDPMQLVATLAHELGHVLLLGDGRIDAETEDHENLTDLLTVYFGLGIFTANRCLHETNWRHLNYAGWSLGRQGYLSLPEWSYALALYAKRRGESAPIWAKHLRADLRALMLTDLARICQEWAITPGNPITADSTDVESRATAIDDPEPQAASNRENESNEIDGAFARGVFANRRGDHSSAEEHFTTAIKVAPEDWEAWAARARLRMNLMRYDEAREDAEQTLRLQPANGAAYLIIARSQLSHGEYEAAMTTLRQADRWLGRDPETALLRGLACAGRGNIGWGLTHIQSAIQQAPRWAICHLASSRLNSRAGRDKAAAKNLAEAIRLLPALADDAYRRKFLEWNLFDRNL